MKFKEIKEQLEDLFYLLLIIPLFIKAIVFGDEELDEAFLGFSYCKPEQKEDKEK